jgi:hypothetical protein
MSVSSFSFSTEIIALNLWNWSDTLLLDSWRFYRYYKTSPFL